MKKYPPKNRDTEPPSQDQPLPAPRGEVSEYIHVTKLVLEEHSVKKSNPILKVPEALSHPRSLKKESAAKVRILLIILGALVVALAVYMIWLR